MAPIRTAATWERIIRNGIFTGMVVVFAILFIRDGYFGYPQDNLEQARDVLPVDQRDLAVINRTVNKPAVMMPDGVTPVFKINQRLREVEAALGPPAWKGTISAGPSPGDAPGGRSAERANASNMIAYWFGPGGRYEVPFDVQGFISNVPRWHDGKHSETDLWVQKALGYGLGPLGVFLLLRMAAMMTTIVVLSDQGLKRRRHPLIPFDAMIEWDTSEYKEKGRIKLHYNIDGRESYVVLDDYLHREFPAIVKEICARRGFENPIRQRPDQAPSESKRD